MYCLVSVDHSGMAEHLSVCTVIPRLTSDPANGDFFAVFRTGLTNMDSGNKCFSGCTC